MQSSHPHFSTSKSTSEKADQSDLRFFVNNPSEHYLVRADADRTGHLLILRNHGAAIDYLSVKISDATGYEAISAVWKAKEAATAAPEKWWQDNVRRGDHTERAKPEPNFLSSAEIAKLKPGMRVSHIGLRPVVDWGAEPIDLNAKRIVKAARTTDLALASPEAAAVFVPTRSDWTDGSDIDPRSWLYDGHYIRKFVSATIAPGGVGKSALKLVEAISMATGQGLLTGKNIKPLRVWLWNGEDPQDETRRRAAAIYRHFGITREDLGDRLFIDSGRSVEIVLAKETRGSLTIVEPVRDALIEAIKKNKIDVLIIDPFVSSHQVSENDNTKIEAVAKTFCKVAERADCAIELVHHSRKTGGAEVGAEDSRGGSALINACRQVRVLNQMTKEEAAKNRIDEATRRRYFRVDDGKANLSPYSEANSWFKIESVMLGNSRPGMAQDNVGVVTTWTKPDAADGLPGNAIEIAQKAIAAGQWRAHVNAGEKWVGRPIAEALGMDLNDKTQKGRVSDLIKEWTTGGYLKVVKRPDDNGDERPFCINGNPWWP